MTKETLITYIRDRFSTDPDYPFDEDDVFVFRHANNRKWFAVLMRVSYQRLGINRPGFVDIVDAKCGPLLMDAYRKQTGILPGYHMNKDNWVTILLDGSTEDEMVKELIEVSYDMTAVRKKGRKSEPDHEEM